MSTKKKTKRQLVPKPYNAGTMTNSMFWSMIRSTLRKASRWWKPVVLVKAAAKRKYNGPNKRQKFEYQCAVCKNYFPEKRINVDHIDPVGSLMCSDDLKGFVERLFCEAQGLQVMCDTCHDKKTKQEKEDRLNKNNKI